MNNLKTIFTIFFSLTLTCLIVLGFFIGLLLKQQFLLEELNINRFKSYLVADELKQSSDDLTQFCRTYVVTGDPAWEKKYWDVLDIRNGKKSRPDGRKISLRGLMKELGFTAAEFRKLKKAEDNSNSLVYTEKAAFSAMKGLYDDGNGNFTLKKTPDAKFAQTIMFDKKYHADKARIMKPIEEFNELLTNRIEDQSKDNIHKSNLLLYIIIGLIALITGINVISFFKIRRLIRERREAENALQKLYQAIEQTDEIIYLADAQGTFTYVNNAFKKIYGYTDEELIGKSNPLILGHENSSLDFYSEFWKSLHEGKTLQYEIINKAKNHTLIPVKASAKPIYDEDGSFIGFIAVQRDMSKEIKSEKELKKSNAQIEMLLNNSSHILYSCKVSDVFETTFVSKNVEAELGYKPSYFYQKNFWKERIHPDDIDHIVKEFPVIFNTDHLSQEYRFKHKDGTWRWLHDDMKLLRDENGKPEMIMGSCSDITERKLAEEVLLESKKALDEAQRMTKLGSWTYNFSTETLFWSEEMYQIFEKDADSFKASLDEMNNLIIGDDKANAVEARKELLKSGNPFTLEYRVLTSDETIKWINAQEEIVFDKNHEHYLLRGIVQDITDIKSKEADLKKHSEALEKMLFITNHKVRQPVANILGISNILDYDSLSAEEIKNTFSFIKEPAKKLDLFTRELTAFLDQIKQDMNDKDK